MWLVIQIIATLLIVITQVIFREYGFCFKSWLIYTIMCSGFVGWMMPYSYSKAPYFYQPYFISIILLSIVGILVSSFYFNESINLFNGVGIIGGLICSFLIVL